MRFGNPMVTRLSRYGDAGEGTETATYGGIAWKAGYYVGLTLVAAVLALVLTYNSPNAGLILTFAIVAPIVAFVAGMIAGFAPRTAPVTGTIYTVFMGLSVGFISAVVGVEYGGIVFAALISTVGVFGVMALLYGLGVIRVGGKFRRYIMSALLGIIVSEFIIFIVALIGGGIGGTLWNMIYGNSWLSIGISAVMVLIAAAFILIDLDNITMTVEGGFEKTYEWTAAFSLTVTLIWLYLEFLQLFLKIASRSKN